MPHPDYFAIFADHRDKSLHDFAQVIERMPKKPVGTVTVAELCSMADYPNGLYLFYDDDDKLWYVGKSTSRSFIERVPAHFDQRSDAWFNTLPKRIMAITEIADYADAHALGLSLRLVLVGIKSKRTALDLETVLRGFMRPHLNPIKKLNYTGAEPLNEYDP